MIERLTKINKYGDIKPPYRLTSQDEEDDWNSDCKEKLAYYEDLEESGRLIINPYKLNDIVYIINEDNKVEETYIDGFEIRRLRDGFELFILIPICDDIRQTGYQTMLQSGVFLTREEAELKLKEMK